jgi:hypothetical protein
LKNRNWLDRLLRSDSFRLKAGKNKTAVSFQQSAFSREK